MEYYESRDDLDELELQYEEITPIQSVFEGAHVFITGASGFMGKVLMEKILRSCNVAKIYILMRDKKGVKSQDRLISLFDDEFFEPLKMQKPGEILKVSMITGDCVLPDLGLSDQDRALLSSVNIIYHAAATLYMDQHLKLAFDTNVVATATLLEFAKTLPHLKAFMYVSTAYTHAYRDLVQEEFYDIEYTCDEIKQICSNLDDTQIGALTPKLIGRWGNTYALTKACAEDLVSKYENILPIGVVRPSIVVNVWREPLKGWTNNVYGAAGVVVGTAIGLLRVWSADPNMVGDMIPVDTAINMTLAATWQVATANKQIKLYNLVSSPKSPITYEILRSANYTHGKTEKLHTVHCIAPPLLYLPTNPIMFYILTLWYHVIPALIVDFYLKFTKSKTRLMKVYTKVYNVNQSLLPYCVEKEIKFTSENVNKMWDIMSPADKAVFYFDLSSMKWDWFWLNALKGLRVYLVKDPMETVLEADKRMNKLRIRKIVIDLVVWTSITSIAYLLLKRTMYSYFQ